MQSEFGHFIPADPEAENQQNSAKPQAILGVQINVLKEFDSKFAQLMKQMEEIRDGNNKKVKE